MDTQFNTLIRSYHDNFLEYRLTNKPSNQDAYKKAEADIIALLTDMKTRNEKAQKDISDFYKNDVQGNLSKIKNETQETQKKLLTLNDQVISAEMRIEPQTPPVDNTLRNKFISIAAIIVVASLL